MCFISLISIMQSFGVGRSFLERAARAMLASLARAKTEQRDLRIINKHADELNAEAEDVLAYQVAL